MKKITEDLEDLDLEVEDDRYYGLENLDMTQFASVSTYNNRDFYIMFFEDFKDYLKQEGLDGVVDDKWALFESLCDLAFGSGNWGDSDSWTTCENCYQAIYLEDYYEHDYYFSPYGCIVCGDCVRNYDNYTDDYIETLINNQDEVNTLLPTQDYFTSRGFEIYSTIDEYSRYNYTYRDNKEIIEDINREHPNSDIIFDVVTGGRRNQVIIWVRYNN